jgi:hypothetical protein
VLIVLIEWGSIESSGIARKLLFLFRKELFIQSAEPLLRVPRRKAWLYLLCRIIGVALLVATSQTIAAIDMFPSHVALVPVD